MAQAYSMFPPARLENPYKALFFIGGRTGVGSPPPPVQAWAMH